MVYYAYIIQSESTGKYYIGHSSRLQIRLLEHNKGSNISTRNRGPWKLMYSEMFETKTEAYRRERQIKSYKGGEAFKKLIGM